jgi:5'-nucleotidase
MNILVTNDDGIDSPGIYALVQELRKIGTVHVVAPDRQQSAVGHAVTVSSPLRATPFHREGAMFGYAVTGTPADCVKLGASTLLEQRPDLLVSGINHGANTSINILYSGTVSAATEGMMMGIPSMAVSLTSFDYDMDCRPAARYAADIARRMHWPSLPAGTLLNVNVPAIAETEIRGIKITTQGSGLWNDTYQRRSDPMGRDYFWLAGTYVPAALRDGYVSVTPIRYQLTDNSVLETVRGLVCQE